MTGVVEKWLDSEVENFPARASGEELYEYMEKAALQALSDSRSEFVMAMTHWLRLRSEPKTMIAVEMIGKFKLSELSEDLEELLDDVAQGKVFKLYYDRPIKKALAMI